MTSIAEYFKDKNIFITGGSGFIGKVLIEKLLRSCPSVGNIYVLLREKKGKSIQDRLDIIKNLKLFESLRKSDPDRLDKLIPVSGDVTDLRLGMSKEDRQLITKNVHIIFHTAASVRFDDSLKYSILMNVRGTKEAVDLAIEVENLLVFVHVSTSFCHIDKKVIDEKMYPPHADWVSSIELAENYDDEIFKAMATKYTDPFPNTYTFAKSLAEHVVNDMCKGKIPALIIRPSVVVSTFEEPFPGWVDNLNGPTGLLVAGGKGLLRTVLGHPVTQDFITVDHVVKIIIMCTQHKVAKRNCDEVDVYNCCKGDFNPTRLDEIIDMGAELVQDSPFSQILWNPNFSMTSCWYNYYIQVILFHMIPAFFIDILLRIAGKKPMVFAIQRKIYIANMVLEYFLKHDWRFINQKILKLYDQLSDEDKSVFGVGAKEFDWDYEQMFRGFVNGKIGVAIHVLKEEFDFTREKSRKNLWRLWVLDKIVKTILMAFALWFFTVKWNIVKIAYIALNDYMKSI